VKCRRCNTNLQLSFLDLGSAPPSNAYLSEVGLRAPELWYPLRLLVCEHCWLVQTEDYADREALFTDDYAYFSSFSSTWLMHAKTYVETMRMRLNLNNSSLVAEVAANDGYLLQYVQEAGIPCYGIEPTASTAAKAKAKGLCIVERFFGATLATELAEQGKRSDLLIANNVLAHVPNINDFVLGFYILLKPSGVATFEFPHLLRMVHENQFDTAYHEHYSYFSLTALDPLFCDNGLQIFDVEELTTHGGSLRIFVQHLTSGPHSRSANVIEIINREQVAGISESNFYSSFQAKAEKVKNDLLSFLIEAKHIGKKVAAYGAAAKGNTLLNFAGVRPDLLAYVVDKNPAKQGKFMPGSRIPIVNEDWLKETQPDYVVILPWNLKAEIMEQLSYIREWKGTFVTAVPKLEVLLQ
jgi:hypothetical protein